MPRKTRLFVRGFKSIGIVDAPACEGSEVVVVKSAAKPAPAAAPTQETAVSKQIVEREGHFCVMDADGKKILGKHKTKKDAQAQLDAIEANAEKRAAGADVWAAALKSADAATRPILDAAETAFLALATKADACEPKTFGEITSNQKVYDEMWRTWDRFSESVRSILQSDATDKAALLTKSADEFQAFLAAAAPKWAVGETAAKKETPMPTANKDKADKPATPTLSDEARKALTPEQQAYVEHLETTAKAEPTGETVSKADHDAALAAKDTEIGALKARVIELDPSASEAEVLKGLSPAAQEMVKAARAKADEALKMAEDERELRETNEAVTTAKALAPLGKPADLGPALRRIKLARGTEEDFDLLDRTLASAAEVVSKSPLFKPIGQDEQPGDGDTAAQKIEVLAQKRATEKGETINKARAEVRKAHRDLARQEREEASAARH